MSLRSQTLGQVLLSAAASFPAIAVTGPRQSGKTTLVRQFFGATHHYCSLIEAFLELFPERATKGYVVCLCQERFPLTRRVDALPLASF